MCIIRYKAERSAIQILRKHAQTARINTVTQTSSRLIKLVFNVSTVHYCRTILFNIYFSFLYTIICWIKVFNTEIIKILRQSASLLHWLLTVDSTSDNPLYIVHSESKLRRPHNPPGLSPDCSAATLLASMLPIFSRLTRYQHYTRPSIH